MFTNLYKNHLFIGKKSEELLDYKNEFADFPLETRMNSPLINFDIAQLLGERGEAYNIAKCVRTNVVSAQ